MKNGSRTNGLHAAGRRHAMEPSEVLELLLRRWRGIALITGIICLAVLAYALRQPPGFLAEARLVLEDESPSGGVLGELAVLSQAPPAAAEIEVLRSRRLAEAVVLPAGKSDFAPEAGRNLTHRLEDLDRYWPWPRVLRRLHGEEPPAGNLEVKVVAEPDGGLEDPIRLEFESNQRVRLVSTAWFGPSRTVDFRPGEPVEIAGARLLLRPEGDLSGRSFLFSCTSTRKAVESLLDRLEVSETKRGSGVLRLAYADRDPVRAADTLNALCGAYITHNRSRLTRRAGSTVGFIESEIERIKDELSEAEQELVEYQEEAGAVGISETAQAMIGAISELELERARVGLRAHNIEHLIGLLEKENTPVEDIAAAADLDPLLARMMESMAELLLQQATMEESYTDKWQPLIELRAQITDLRARIRTNLVARLDGLRDQQSSIGEVIEGQRQELEKLPKTERELARFLRRAESYEGIYTFLLAQLQEAKIAEAAAVAAVEVIDWAVPPLTRFKPSITLHLLIGLLLGLCAGAGFTLLRETSLRKILRAVQLERATGLSVIGAIPDFRRGRARCRGVKGKYVLPLRDAPDSPASEAYLALRAYLRHGSQVSKVKTLAITAAGPGEGKSVTTASLAMALAKGGNRVLLVDTDMRKPMVDKLFDQRLAPGLSEILSGSTTWGQALRVGAASGLELICAGDIVSNPGDLLASRAMTDLVRELAEHFDYVLFDVPPVLAVADATGFLAELDGVFLLCRADRAPESAVVGASRRLELSGGKLMGAIFNGFRPSRFSGGYGAYGYGYGYGETAGRGTVTEAEVVAAKRDAGDREEPPLGT